MELSPESTIGSHAPSLLAKEMSSIANHEVREVAPEVHGAYVTSMLPAAIEAPAVPSNHVLVTRLPRFPDDLPRQLGLVLAQNGKAYAVMADAGNPYVLAVGSRRLNNIIRELAHDADVNLRKAEISEINDILQAKAETAGVRKFVWLRVAPIPGGSEIDSGDDNHTRFRITADKVEIIEGGSESLFYRTQSCQPMCMPAQVGNLKLLKKYLNLDWVSFVLLIAWLSYTLAHPKASSSVYVILVLKGGQGSGKSTLSKRLTRLIDPRLIGVQILPSNGKDLAIATQNAHVNCYDNLRNISHSMSDLLCIAATGGAITSRQLYTDADQQAISLHGALIINGIPSIVDQPDLAQRCLSLQLTPLSEGDRKSDAEMAQELEADLPAIQRGLFDVIAKVFFHLPAATVTHPERMIDFVKWLAAMEIADGTHAGTYQGAYSEALNEGQRDSLQDNVLAAAVLEYAESGMDGQWSGTPTELLTTLNLQATHGTQRSKEWPQTPIALSKRLLPLQTSLLSQGVSVELSRGKHRTISIKKLAENTKS